MLKKLIINNEPNDCVIKWRFSRLCNAHCSYCLQGQDKEPLPSDLSPLQTKLENTASQINRLLNESKFNSIKIDAVGGEVTIFNCIEILKKIPSPKFARFSVTTNFLRNAEYYIELAEYLKNRGVELSLTVSWHQESLSLEQFLEKSTKVEPLCAIFSCETVSCVDNQEGVQRFVDECQKRNWDFFVDVDRRKSADKIDRKSLIRTSNRIAKNKLRYHAEFDDGTVKDYKTRNDVLLDEKCDGIVGRCIKVQGLYCSYGMDYIYVDQDGVVACESKDRPHNCCSRCKIEDFKWGNGIHCNVYFCTFCGNMSILGDERPERS